ncbi:hypothetical protein [Arthrobacter bambusae]|uniref:hypothetical protein n=1 Tax=Arthrobacter bambusae TaxID=1338426 RepID=UPI0027D7B824|nr:hypothetical protein [Arthrobacter bambusae]
MFERSERWTSPLSPESALEAVSTAFSSKGARFLREGNILTVRQGSNWKYRLLGNLFPGGRRNVPVALTLKAIPSAEGSDIEAHAFDTFGVRLVEHAFFGAQKTFEEQLENLLGTAAEAARVVLSR